MSKQKFQIGDYVVVKSGHYTGEKGVIKVIKSRLDRKIYYIKTNSDRIHSYYSYELQKAYKFEFGDRVILTKIAIDWLKKYDTQHNVDSYDTVYVIDKRMENSGKNLYRIKRENDDRVIYVIYFFDEDLESYVESKENSIEKSKIDVTKTNKKDRPIQFVEFSPQDTIDKNEEIKSRIKKWNQICNEYLNEFCVRHDYTFENDMWVGGDIGTVVLIGDMYVSMDEIRYDVDNNINEDYFEQWYWKKMEVAELTDYTENYMNYESYCKGAPDYWTKERMQSIRASKKRVEEVKAELLKEIENTREGKLF